MYVCLCNAVTECDVRHAVALGAANLDDLSTSLGVATCCGKCADCARGILEDEVNKERISRNKSRRIPIGLQLQASA